MIDGDEPCRGVYDEDDEPSEPPEPEFTCYSCMDFGYIAYYHASFDYPIGSDPCPELGNPDRHPPAAPVPVQVTTMLGRVPGHDAGCDGACNYGYPDGCPPF